MGKLEDLLREFGLTEYEIKAFVTLLKLDTVTAEQISELGNIPLPRVYDTLAELKKKGFVLISKTRPKKFKSIKPEKALESLIKMKKDEFNKKMGQLEDNIEQIKQVLPDIETISKTDKEEVFTLWSTEKRVNVVKLLNEKLALAKSEVLCFAGDLSWFPESIDAIKSALKRKVKIKILAGKLKDSEEFMKNINRAKKMGLKIKTGYDSVLRGYIIDGNIASLAIKTSNKGVNIIEEGLPKNDRIRKYELLTIENSIIARALKENFDFWWSSLK